MELICRELDLEHLSEVGIATACEHMVSLAKDLTYSNTECFARACLLPQVTKYCLIWTYLMGVGL